MSKLLSALIAAVFATVSLGAVAADADKTDVKAAPAKHATKHHVKKHHAKKVVKKAEKKEEMKEEMKK